MTFNVLSFNSGMLFVIIDIGFKKKLVYINT